MKPTLTINRGLGVAAALCCLLLVVSDGQLRTGAAPGRAIRAALQ